MSLHNDQYNVFPQIYYPLNAIFPRIFIIQSVFKTLNIYGFILKCLL